MGSATASASMSLMSSYSDTFPVLQRSKFWSDYMSALKGPLCADEPTYTLAQPSIWTQYRPVDITLYDLMVTISTSTRPHLLPLHIPPSTQEYLWHGQEQSGKDVLSNQEYDEIKKEKAKMSKNVTTK